LIPLAPLARDSAARARWQRLCARAAGGAARRLRSSSLESHKMRRRRSIAPALLAWQRTARVRHHSIMPAPLAGRRAADARRRLHA